MTNTFPLPLAEVPGTAPSPALAAMRQSIAEAVCNGTWTTTATPEESCIAGVRVLRHASARPARGAVVHFHGGGYRMGMPETVGLYAQRLAERCHVDVWCPAYRLAPDYPLPAALNDGWAVVCALAAQYGRRLILAGDSAGGGLAASLAAVCRAADVSLGGLILHSPWLDLTVSSPTYASNEQSDPLFSRAAAQEAAQLYLQGRCPSDDPLASPLFADPASFPPTLITVGTGEVLAGDARALHGRLAAVGIGILLMQIDGMDHVAVTRGQDLPGAAQAFAATQAFLEDRWGL